MLRPNDPELFFADDGAPRSGRFGDVYYSLQDGLAESRAVFFDGCGWPDAWRGRRAFTLLEALIAVAMIGLLAGALAIFVDDLATTRAHVTRTTDRARSADAVFGVVEAALQTAVVDGGRLGAGVSGSPDGLRVLSSRTDAVGSTGAQLARAAFAPVRTAADWPQEAACPTCRSHGRLAINCSSSAAVPSVEPSLT